MSPASTTERLWTQQEAADWLGVHTNTLRLSACPRILVPMSGKVPLVRYAPNQVRDWAAGASVTRRGGA